MTPIYQRIPITDRIGFSEILDPKLKTNTLRITFLVPLSDKTASANALVGELITSSNAIYRTNAAMNRKLHLLYGADLGASVTRQGDLQVLSIRASSIADTYALEGEAVFDELTEILLDCLCKPNVQANAFDKAEFQMKQAELLDNIDAEINEKRTYAIRQAQKTAYIGEPAALSAYGTREQAAALTSTCVYEAFQSLLQTARIELFFVGPSSQPQLPQKFRDVFSAFSDKAAVPITFSAPSPKKDAPVTVREMLPVNQCKMVMAWKTQEQNRYAAKLAALILGGTPSAKLFANVREKMSLCYYCAANYAEYKQTLLVDCGIETENIEKTKTAIEDQLKAMCQGEITEEEIQSAQMFIHNSLRSIGDTPSSYISWYLGQIARNTNLSPEQEEAAYGAVTKEQIVAAAKSMQPDTIYTMECKA